jgi:N utilization substance protein B
MGLRRKSRELALQTLYSIEFIEKLDMDAKDLLEPYKEKFYEIVENSDHKVNNAIEEFALSLIKAVLENKEDIDNKIQGHLINWTVENIANLDKTILRLGIAEMIYIRTPYPVVINEAVEITKRYSSDSSAKFINGILDAIKKELENEKTAG